MEIISKQDLKEGRLGYLCPNCESCDTFTSMDANGKLILFCNRCGKEYIIKDKSL